MEEVNLVKSSFLSLIKKTKEVFLSDEEEGDEGKLTEEPKKVNSNSLPKDKKKKKVHDEAPKPAPKPAPAAPRLSTEKPKQNTLLELASTESDGECNSNVGKRLRSMKLAKSMGSVYKKLNKDSNIHNDRHYLVAVAEQLKSPQPPRSPKKSPNLR